MKILKVLVCAAALSISAPALPCGSYEPEAPGGDSASMGLVVTGGAFRLDEREPAAPIVSVSYPMTAGQKTPELYMEFFTLVVDDRYAELERRLTAGRTPRVVLARATESGPWRVAGFVPTT